ncbi:MAG: NADH-quinone oxidoreductase subunit NuoF [Actinomycetota bacterium]
MPDLVVTKRYTEHPSDSHSLERALSDGAYEGLRKAVRDLTPSQLVELVTTSGLRGRGGAGFPTGMKWSFIPVDVFPRYIVVNDDEGEPGTFKDRELTERDPHALLEGALIAAYAIQAERVFIYVRGEFALGRRRLLEALATAKAKGSAGRNIAGSDFSCEVVIHRGAGAYICGEETALLDSLEGYRGQPRLRPPFPAVRGLNGSPTVVNNVETLANLPHLVLRGSDWLRSVGTEKSPGTKVFSMSGHVAKPGNYEAPLGTRLADLIDLAGGIPGGRSLKAVIPGGASAPWLTTTDIAMDFESLAAAGTMLGSGGVVVMDETTCPVRMALVIGRFFNHESCGKCTPCREGTWWIRKVLERLERGEGRAEDADLLLSICENMLPEAGAPASGRSFCPLGDSAAWSLRSSIKLFREEFLAHIGADRCPIDAAMGVGASG